MIDKLFIQRHYNKEQVEIEDNSNHYLLSTCFTVSTTPIKNIMVNNTHDDFTRTLFEIGPSSVVEAEDIRLM